MVKEFLRRGLGPKTISYIKLETVLYNYEETINSRPLTYLVDEMTKLKPLTLAYFIQRITHIDVTDLDTIESSSLNRHLQHLQKLRNVSCSRFTNYPLDIKENEGETR